MGAFLKTPDLAHIVFGQNTHVPGSIPYLGFEYYVRINFNGELTQDLNSIYFSDAVNSETVSPMIKSVDMPSMSIDTESINEYNRWRISQSKIKYDPVKIKMHDSVNGVGLLLWDIYYRYYFRDGSTGTGTSETTGKVTHKRDIPTIPDSFTISGAFGYNKDEVLNARDLITSIDIFQVHGSKFRRTTLINPRISSFDHDTFSYDSSEGMELTYTFEYEYVIYQNAQTPLFDSTILNSSFSWDDMQLFFSKSNMPEVAGPTPTILGVPDYNVRLAGFGLAEAANVLSFSQSNTITTALNSAQSNSQSVLGQVAALKGTVESTVSSSVGSLSNMVDIATSQINNAIPRPPSVRNFTASIKNIPNAYPDVGRVLSDRFGF